MPQDKSMEISLALGWIDDSRELITEAVNRQGAISLQTLLEIEANLRKASKTLWGKN